MAGDYDSVTPVIRGMTRLSSVVPAGALASLGLFFTSWPLFVIAAGWYGIAIVRSVVDPPTAQGVIEPPVAPTREIAGPSVVSGNIEIVGLQIEADREQRLLEKAIEDSPLPLPELRVDLIGMRDDLGVVCSQADRLSAFISSINTGALERRRADTLKRRSDAVAPELIEALDRTLKAIEDQLAVAAAMSEQYARFIADATGIILNLGSIRAEVVRIAVSANDDASERVIERIGLARREMGELRVLISEQKTSRSPSEPPT